MNDRKIIQKSINFYTISSQDCERLKILMSPIELLGQIKDGDKINTNKQANLNLYNFISNLTNDEHFHDEFNNNVLVHRSPKTFIKKEDVLYQYLVHIQNILLGSYLNYHDSSKKIPLKLYRSVTLKELEYLKKARQIDTLWSTTSTLESVINYTLEEAEHEWEPKEHFIIELSTKNKIPFIDVDNDAKRIFEPNEFILTPPFNVSKLKLVKSGGMDAIGFYNPDTIPIYSAELKTNYNFQMKHQVTYEQLYKQFKKIEKDINKYGRMIEGYLNNNSTNNNLLHNQEYRVWARNLIELIQLLQQYTNEYAKEYIACNHEQPKMKILK